MIVDLSHYRVNMPAVQRFCDLRLGDLGVERCMTELAITTSCPCIVIAFYIGELYGFTDEVNRIIKRLTEFYGYTEIKGRKDNGQE